ncbi:DNA internalization-related competence protein ComEC/Rec2 [Thermodesulfobacteriota bacterium]
MRDRPLIAILLSFLAGLLFGALFLPHHSPWVIVLSFSLILIILVLWIISHKTRFQLILPGFFLLGIFLIQQGYHSSDLHSWAERGKRVTIEGVVLEPSKRMEDRIRLLLRADWILLEGRERRVNDRILVNIFQKGRAFVAGEKIRLSAKLRPFRNFNNPGRYNYERAMQVRGITCAASVSDGRRIVSMGRGRLGFPGNLLEKVRSPVRDFFSENLSPDDRALYLALVLGERQELTPEVREPFDRAGLGHILAVSGLHIGLVAWLVFTAAIFCLSRSYWLVLRFSLRKAAAILTCFPVIAYACIAGFQVSSQRAMIMVLAFLLSIVLGREKDLWSTLALAALLVLAINPLAIFSISFQLSFFAVTGILWLTPALHRRMFQSNWDLESKKTFSSRLLAYAAGLISVTLSATIFLLPLTAFYFHRVSLVSLPANLLVVPVMGFWVLPLGLLASLSLPFSQPLAAFFLGLGTWGLEWIREIAGALTRFSWSSIWVITPNILELSGMYGLLFFLFFFRGRRWAKAGLCLILLLMTVDVFYWVYRTQFNPHVKVTFLDVGQGSSALVQLPGGKRMLIDGGGYPGNFFDTGRMVVAPFLLREKIKRVDYLILSHPQSDHMNGLGFIASHFNPREFWSNGVHVQTSVYRELMAIISSKNIKARTPLELAGGMEISEVKIDVLHPPTAPGESPGQDNNLGVNNLSLVLKLTYRGVSILFPGDLEKEGEAMVVSRAGSSLGSDVLVAPHHGSRGSCTKAFLEKIRPRVVIISCGKGNTFGFPHRETIQRIKEVKGRVIRIDRAGAIDLTISPKGLDISSFLGGKEYRD